MTAREPGIGQEGKASRVKTAARVTALLLKEAVAMRQAGEMDDATLMAMNRAALETLNEALAQQPEATSISDPAIREDGKV